MMSKSKIPALIQPVRVTEEWPSLQLCVLCNNDKPADKKITTYNAPDGIPRISWYCNYCIETEFPQFKI